MRRTLDIVRAQISNAIQSFGRVTGCAPSDLYIGREELLILAGDSEGGWHVADDQVKYKGLIVSQVAREAHIGVGFSR